MKKTKDKEMVCETDLRFESWLYVRKVLTPYNVCPKSVPLIK